MSSIQPGAGVARSGRRVWRRGERAAGSRRNGKRVIYGKAPRNNTLDTTRQGDEMTRNDLFSLLGGYALLLLVMLLVGCDPGDKKGITVLTHNAAEFGYRAALSGQSVAELHAAVDAKLAEAWGR